MTLNYQKIQDTELSFADRIVYSILCTACHFNKDLPSVNHIRHVTGFRHHSIMQSLHVLRERGWILNDVPVQSKDVRFEKISIVEGSNVKQQVFFHVVTQISAYSTRKLGQCYWAKVFGISRQYAKQLIDKMADGWTPDAAETNAKAAKPTRPTKSPEKPAIKAVAHAVEGEGDIYSALQIGVSYAIETYTPDAVSAYWTRKGKTPEWINTQIQRARAKAMATR